MTAIQDWNYRQALEELWRRSSYERGLISDPFGDSARAQRSLERMRALLVRMGNPQHRYPTVHIAGSKGKGSTGAFIATAAKEAGLRVGHYTSPHPHRFPERIAINGRPISDEEFAAATHEASLAATALESGAARGETVSTFELLTAMGFAEFARQQCGLAVIEVGLGGRYDSTNVLQPLVSVITRIDLEHTAVLGSTHGEIAAQKSGIMQPGIPCVSSPQVAEAQRVIEQIAGDVGAPLSSGGRDWHWTGSWQRFTATGPWGEWEDLRLGLAGPHQVENACTALAALHILNTSGMAIGEGAVRRGIAHAEWPGRFERISTPDRVVVFDAAHTPAAAAALVETWRSAILPAKATVILGMGSDKDPRAFLETIAPIAARIFATRAQSPRAADPHAIAAIAEALGIPSDVQTTVASAVDAASETIPTPLLITGSLFVAGEGREAFGLAQPDEVWRALSEERRPTS